jgi:hypothetical protein
LIGQSEAAGGVLTAKQAPRRPGSAPALGLRAGCVAAFIVSQTTIAKETSMWFQSLVDSLKSGFPRRPPRARHRSPKRPPPGNLAVEALEDRTVPSFVPAVPYNRGSVRFVWAVGLCLSLALIGWIVYTVTLYPPNPICPAT